MATTALFTGIGRFCGAGNILLRDVSSLGAAFASAAVLRLAHTLVIRMFVFALCMGAKLPVVEILLVQRRKTHRIS